MQQNESQLSKKLVQAAQQVTVGGRYVHYRQRGYRVVALVLREEDCEPCVIYQAEYSDKLTWCRPVTSWLEKVEVAGKRVKRFTKVAVGAEGKRCEWANSSELMAAYHDEQWGVPVHDDRLLFEMLNLEGAQAGLSWLTILTRRDNYRKAFDNFDAKKIARYDEQKRAALLQDAGIIRNRLKINAVIENAKACLAAQQKHGSLDAYLWSFVAGKQLTQADQQQATEISKQMSKALKKDGFRFVGPTTCYAYMQAVGMINDHEPVCFRYGDG
jgi:DNA-3-methyladenine glycosylase I